MHERRLAYLAYQRAPLRKVTARDVRTNGTTLALVCGHVGQCVPHVAADTILDWRCYHCGVAIVKAAPEYASEFKAG